MTDHQQSLTETQALAWLHAQPDGTIATTVSDLARSWGWNRSTTSRRVKAWVASGQIVRTPGLDGRSTFTASTPDVPQPCDTTATLPPPSAKSLVIPTVSLPVQSAARGEHPVIGVVQHFGPSIAAVRVTRAAGGAALAALAVAVAWFGIRINAWYGGTLGRTPEASTLLSGLSVSADVLALILPTTARTLWTDRRRMAAVVAWALWTITIAVALMATVGFAALNIADTTAARAKTVTERAELTARIERLRSERGGITESRSVAAIEAELDRDNTASGQRHAATVRAGRPTPEAKAEAWASVVESDELPNALQTATIAGLLDPDHRELMRPYVDRYFASIGPVWASRSPEMASNIVVGLYPALFVEEAIVERTEAYIAEQHPVAPVARLLAEGRDGVQRALRCQTRDSD